MADKPNKSSKPINGQLPSYIEGAFKSRADDIANITERADVSKLQGRLEDLETLAGLTTSGPDLTSITENISYAQYDIDRSQELAARAYNATLGSAIGTATKFGNVNKRTTTMAGGHKFYRMAQASPDIYQSTELIEQRIQDKMQQVNTYGTEVAGRARGLGQDDIPESVMQRAGQIGALEQSIALDKRLLKVQNKAGLSTEKLHGSAEATMDRTERYFEGKGVEAQVGSRNVGTIGEETKSLGMTQRGVFVAQQAYDEALDAGAKDLSSFGKALDEATNALGKQQRLVDEMNKQGVGGGGMGWGDIGKVVALGGRAVAHTARSTRQMMVDNDITEMSMKAKFASMGNTIYQRADEAIMGGNMDSLLELTGGSLQFARSEALFNKRTTNILEGTAQVGDAAVGVGNTIQAGIDGTKAGVVTGKAAAISQGVIEAASAANRADMLRRGLYGGEKALQTYDTAMGLSKQMRMMDSKMMQSVYDQGMTTYNSVTGLGGAAAIQSQLLNTDTLGRMAGVGLTPEKAAQLTAGMRAAGAMSTSDAMKAIEGAGAAKQRGILGQEEYVGMAAQLMGAGGGAGDMESIMAAAVAAGMDNSKSISELVSGTLALSQGLTGMGVSATTSTQGMLAGASQALVRAGVDPNLAANAAAMSIGNYNQAQGSSDFTLGNIMERAQLRRQFKGASIFQLNRLSEMTTSDHKVLLDAANNPNNQDMQDNANQLLKGKGLSQILNPDGEGIKLDDVVRMTQASFTATGVDIGALGAKGVNLNTIFAKAQNKEELSDQEMAFLGQFGGRGEAIISAIKGDDPATQDPNTKKKITGAGVGETQAGFKLKELSDAEAKSAAKTEDIFKSLEETLKGVQENIGPEKIGEITEKAAANFEVPVLEFQKGSSKFNEAVDKFISWQNKRMGAVNENGTKTPNKALEEQENAGQAKVENWTPGGP